MPRRCSAPTWCATPSAAIAAPSWPRCTAASSSRWIDWSTPSTSCASPDGAAPVVFTALRAAWLAALLLVAAPAAQAQDSGADRSAAGDTAIAPAVGFVNDRAGVLDESTVAK